MSRIHLIDGVALALCICIAVTAAYASHSSQTVPTSTPVRCPDPVALDLFRHQIAYEKTEESDPLRGLPLIHADVWAHGPLTAFYIQEREHCPSRCPELSHGFHIQLAEKSKSFVFREGQQLLVQKDIVFRDVASARRRPCASLKNFSVASLIPIGAGFCSSGKSAFASSSRTRACATSHDRRARDSRTYLSPR